VTSATGLTEKPSRADRLQTSQFSRGLLLNAAGLVLLAGTLWLVVRSKPGPGIWEFLLALAVMWTAVIGAFLAARSSASRSIRGSLWIFAIACRIAGLFAEPIFEDDWYRYLWDGRNLVVEGDPYKSPPAAYFTNTALTPAFERILDNINHPDVPTIYGPICQYLFAFSYLIAQGQLWPVKLLLILADVLLIFCLLRLTSPRNTLLYAWCPLVLHETAINAHTEILGVAPAMLALFLLARGQTRSALVTLGISVAARIHGVLLAPFLVLQTPWKRWWIFPVMMALLYLPFWVQGSLGDWAGLRAFLQHWEFNSTIFAVVAWMTGTPAAKLICASTFALVYAVLLRRQPSTAVRSSGFSRSPIPPGDLVYGIFFLLSAVVNPWYVLWLAPFMALFPSFTGVTACAVVSLSYVHGLNWEAAALPPYEHPWWVRPAEIAAVAIAFIADCLQTKRNAR
jgi:alpha-1,6-mannosyltransferase